MSSEPKKQNGWISTSDALPGPEFPRVFVIESHGKPIALSRELVDPEFNLYWMPVIMPSGEYYKE